VGDQLHRAGVRLGQIGAGQVHFDNLVLTAGATDTTTLTSSQNPTLAGVPITFTAMVTATGGMPTGSVTFLDGNTSLGAGTLDGSGMVVLTTALVASGSPHSLTAIYAGDSNFAYSVSAPLVQIVTNSPDSESDDAPTTNSSTITVLNFSFESPAGPQGTVAGVPDGWVPANLNSYGVYNPAPGLYTNVVNNILPAPADGSQVLWIDSYNYVAQFLTNTLVANQTYTLSGAIGNRADGYGIQLPEDYEYVYLLAGGTIIASNTDLPHPAPGSFLPWAISYTAPASGLPSGPLEIRLGQIGGGEVHYDNLALTINQGSPPPVLNSTNSPVLANFSFEIPAGAQGTVAGYPDGWVAANLNPYGVYNPAPGLYTNFDNDILPAPADGSQVLWIDSYNYVAHFMTNTLTANQTYTLSGAIGNRGDGYGIQLPTDQEYVFLLAGGTIIASNVNLPHPDPGSFLPWTITYTAPASGFPTGSLEIRLGQIGAGQVHFDNIVLATVSNTTTVASSQDTAQPAIVLQPPVAPVTRLTMLPDRTMQLDCVGAPGSNYVIQATTDLSPGFTWTRLSTNTADANGLFRYIDLDATNYNSRFYLTTTH
jgi:hypothetical protein